MDYTITVVTKHAEFEFDVVSPLGEDEIADALREAMIKKFGGEEGDIEDDGSMLVWPQGWNDLSDATITSIFGDSDEAVELELTVAQVHELADLKCKDEAVFVEALGEYSADLSSAISLVEGGYSVMDKDYILKSYYECFDKTTVEALRPYVDEERLLRACTMDYTEMDDGRYIEWHR